MSRRQHHRSIPRKGELSTEVMGSQNTAPAPHRAGCVGAMTTSKSDGHRAPCTTSQRTRNASGKEDMQQARLHNGHRCVSVHHTCTRGRQSPRHTDRTWIRQELPSSAQSMGPQDSNRHRHMPALPQAAASRRTVPPRARRQRPQHHPWSRVPAVQPQRGRQGSAPVRLDTLGDTLSKTPKHTTAGEVFRWCGGFKIFRHATKWQFQATESEP